MKIKIKKFHIRFFAFHIQNKKYTVTFYKIKLTKEKNVEKWGKCMIDKLCENITARIRKEMPEIDDEKAEIIHFGVSLIFGELPKIFFMFAFGIILGLWWQTLLAFFLILPYRVASGGFHLKTHIGCFLCTNIIYCGNAYLSTIWNFPNEISKYITIGSIFILGVILVSIYAPADTENIPIISKKERRTKKILSYVFLILNMIGALFIPNTTIANILIFGTLVQTLSITRVAYILTKNKYGYEEYLKAQETLS